MVKIDCNVDKQHGAWQLQLYYLDVLSDKTYLELWVDGQWYKEDVDVVINDLRNNKDVIDLLNAYKTLSHSIKVIGDLNEMADILISKKVFMKIRPIHQYSLLRYSDGLIWSSL